MNSNHVFVPILLTLLIAACEESGGGTTCADSCPSWCATQGALGGYCSGEVCHCTWPEDTSTDTAVDTSVDTTPDTTPDTIPDTTPDTAGCTSSTDCAADRVCMYGECRVPWGQEFEFLLRDGLLPERRWQDGDVYDAAGGMPDPQVDLTIDGTMCSTSTIDDTLSPVWNHSCYFTVYATSTMTVHVWDEDLTDWDVIAQYEGALSIDALRGGGVFFTVDTFDTGTTYTILNMVITPR